MIGLLAAFGLILLSGVGLDCIFRAHREDDLLFIRIGYWVGLGFVFNVLLLFLALTGIPNNFGGELSAQSLLGVRFYAIVGIDLGAFACGIISQRKYVASFFKHKEVRWFDFSADLKVFIPVAILAVFLFLYFLKFPIFPEFDSVDFHQHFASAVTTETEGVPIGTGISYWGVIYLLAFVLRFENGIPLVVVRESMEVIVLLSCFIVYLVSARLFGKEKAIWPLVVYALGGLVWWGMVENAGLYPNFYGVVSSLFLVGITIDYFEHRDTILPTALFSLSLFDLFFSHYSSFFILPPLLVYAVFRLRKQARKSIFLAASIVLPALYLVLGPFHLLAVLLSSTSAGVNPIAFTTGLSSILSGMPVISWIVAFAWSDFAALALLLSIPVFLYLNIGQSKQLIVWIWFGTILVLSPFNVASWRFSLVALVPLTLMLGFVLAKLMEKPKRTFHDIPGFYPGRALGVIVILVLVLTGGIEQIANTLPNNPQAPQAQQNVYDALKWFSEQTCVTNTNDLQGPCTFVTPTDWKLAYSSQMFGDNGEFSCSFLVSPATASYAAVTSSAKFMIVTDETTCTPFPCPSVLRLQVMNSTAGRSLRINVTATYGGIPDGTPIEIGVNQTHAGVTYTANQTAFATVHFPHSGFYTVQAALNGQPSWIENVYMGLDVRPTSTPYSFTSCLPWNWTSFDLYGATLVYQNADVKIWALTK